MSRSFITIAVLACMILALLPLTASAGRIRRSSRLSGSISDTPHILNNVSVSTGNW